MILKVEYLENYLEEWEKLYFQHHGDSGFDLRCAKASITRLFPGQTVTISTGIKVAVQNGYEMQVRPRSGKSNLGLHVHFGTIDFGYRGEIKIVISNLNMEGFIIINPGDRIAQGVIQRIPEVVLVEIDAVSPNTSRGTNGFGSSGG